MVVDVLSFVPLLFEIPFVACNLQLQGPRSKLGVASLARMSCDAGRCALLNEQHLGRLDGVLSLVPPLHITAPFHSAFSIFPT